jgi:Raf kinase inhibitor-like YbhB/YbcL family protein
MAAAFPALTRCRFPWGGEGRAESTFAQILTLLLSGAIAGCGSEGDPRGQSDVALDLGADASIIALTSSAFVDGGPIPPEYTADGDDVSPPLAWSGLPEGTKELALICEDPDAPGPAPWVHWVIYGIPADTNALPEGVPRAARPEEPQGALQGTNSWKTDNIGYRGPSPPSGRHRYFFKLYALDKPLSLEEKLDKSSLVNAMSNHVIGKGQLMGTYER